MYYTETGKFDKRRIQAHFAWMSPYIHTYLIPGSTGDGWELSPVEINGLLEFIIKNGRELNIQFLIGVLRPAAADTLKDLNATMDLLKGITGNSDPEKAMELSGVCGFTICAPKGAALSHECIKSEICRTLDTGYPIALYQLPQVTENEISPDTFEALAENYSNFYLFKDTSGRDEVARSGVNGQGVFMLRGGEGDYRKWYKAASGGVYDGFLLGSANCFAAKYGEMIKDIEAGRKDAAEQISSRISETVIKAMELAEKISFGNAFANSNKAIDHFLAYGSDALLHPAPMTHSGKTLPVEYLQAISVLLKDKGLMPEGGYLGA
jgi:dihydrodipicolinate synthase/N-acetylneuraminate lyase